MNLDIHPAKNRILWLDYCHKQKINSATSKQIQTIKQQPTKNKQVAIIFGGTGYIGSWTWKRLLPRFGRIILADIRPPSESLPEGVFFVECDTRKPIEAQLRAGGVELGARNQAPSPKQEQPCAKSAQQPATSNQQPTTSNPITWIFNYAAVHREPGHDFQEYFDTNLPNAEEVTLFARDWNVPNIFFTASIAVYGPTLTATSEATPKYPNSGYGISKLAAELIHERWAAESQERRLIICRPGVVYGPGDPGNILRMIKAVEKGLFFFPGNPEILKSYAYIEGLLDSVEFTMARPDKVIRYNYVESPTEPLKQLIQHVEALRGKKSKVLSLPIWMLLPAAHILQLLTKGRSPIHPKRVQKAAMPTHIIPQWLKDEGFCFKYDFPKSLEDWKRKAPEDFSAE